MKINNTYSKEHALYLIILPSGFGVHGWGVMVKQVVLEMVCAY